MKRLWLRPGITLTLVVMLMSLATPVTPTRAQESEDYRPHEVVLKLIQATDLAGVASDYALDPTPLDQFGTRAIYRMSIVDDAAPPVRAAALTDDPRVVYAEPNFLGGTPEGQQRVSWARGDEGGGYAGQWAVSMIRLPEAHTVTRGAGVTVAVLDTGVVSPTHPALAGRLVDGFDFVDDDADPSEVGTHDQNVVYGHGTHVAGLIALVVPEARIMPVRVLDPDGVGNIWVIAEALAYAVNPDGDLNTADGAHVINLSLSTTRPTELLAEIVEDVTCSGDDNPDCLVGQSKHGAVVVAAAGNGVPSGSSTPEYPAAEGVAGSLAVGASTPTDTLALFSNYGPWVRVAAPGENILSSVPGGEYAVWSGTSMATPLAAGEAALVRAAVPGLDTAAVVKRIIETSADISGPVPLRIDAAAALGLPLVPISGEYRCMNNTTLGPVTVGNLQVPAGHTCTLVGTRVKGNVEVEAGATLNASGIHVKGSVQAKGAAFVNLSDSTVAGSVKVEESGSARLHASQIHGNVLFVKNTGRLTISGNTIGGNLQCKENNPSPSGGGNSVRGNKEEQCSGL